MITSYMSNNPVTVIGVMRGGEWARVRRQDGSEREWRIGDLRSDTIEELETALCEAPIYTDNDVVDGKLRNI